MKPDLRLKRVYEPAAPEDGCRILVERLWPRGLTKERAQVDLWAKEVAPSHELRRWFGHDPAKWNDFKARYRAELAGHPEVLDELLSQLRAGPVTLVYAASDPEHNSALVLRDLLAAQAD
ncbi:MAG TPA: DUF488 domain-containing protein [Parasulfuritortus sp.]